MLHRIKSFLLIFGDLGILFLSLFITVLVYERSSEEAFSYLVHVEAFKFIFPIWLLMYYIEGFYSLRTFKIEGFTFSLIRASIINSIVAFIFFYLFPFEKITPKTNILIIGVLNIFFIFLWRKIFFAVFSAKGLKVPTILIGPSEATNEIEEVLAKKDYLGFEIIQNTNIAAAKVLNPNADLIAIDRNMYSNKEFLQELINQTDRKRFIELSKFSELVTGKVLPNTINESWFIENALNTNERLFNLFKNLLDKSVSLIIMLIFLPVYIILIPLLLIISGRPIFYSQIRTGINNKPFRIYKLRTMTVNAEKDGAKWATPKDNRVTPIGKFLRMSRLDELPQLWNIFNGDMSIVGPRPERPEIIEEKLEPNIPFYKFRHLVKPGVTGWAQVNYRYGYSEEDSLIKLTYDLYYVKNKSIALDIRIILKTIKTVITGMGH